MSILQSQQLAFARQRHTKAEQVLSGSGYLFESKLEGHKKILRERVKEAELATKHLRNMSRAIIAGNYDHVLPGLKSFL